MYHYQSVTIIAYRNIIRKLNSDRKNMDIETKLSFYLSVIEPMLHGSFCPKVKNIEYKEGY